MLHNIIFYSITLVLACALINIVAHELTHYALLGNADGICFGNCSIGQEKVGFGAIYYSGPVLPSQQDENIPTAVGLIAAISFGAIGIKLMGGIINELD